MTAPSVEDVMRKESSRGPSIRWVGASEEIIQLSTTEPMVEPAKPPMVAALTPRMDPPMLPPRAVPAAPRTSVAMGTSRAKDEGKTEEGIGQKRLATGGRWVDPACLARQAMAMGGKQLPGRHDGVANQYSLTVVRWADTGSSPQTRDDIGGIWNADIAMTVKCASRRGIPS